MARKDMEQRIVGVLEQKVLFRTLQNVDMDEALGEGGIGIDSLNFLKFLTELEKEMDIRIEDDYWDYEYMNTLNKITDYIMLQLDSAAESRALGSL